MKNKKVIAVIAAFVFLICVMALVFILSKESGDKKEPIGSSDELNSEDGLNSEDEDKTTSDKDSETDIKEPDKGNNTTTSNVNENVTIASGIVFPYNIPNSNLTVMRIDGYSGPYVEDGTDQNIENVTAMVLKNAGSKPVEYAEITVKCGEEDMIFTASAIPAGKSVVVQEKNKRPYVKAALTDCKAEVAEIDQFEMSEEFVTIEENDISLTVKNITDKDIASVRIFYKYYMEDEEAYVGGITYTARITGLKAGEEKEISPKHYAKGSSKIMMVRVYETE